MLSQGESLWTGSLKDRIQFKQHDYYQPQPIRDAGAFFIRQVVHNLNDSQFIKLLQATVPALEECASETPLLINDTVLPDPGEKPAWEEWSLRQMDLCMWVCFGAKQRSVNEFRKLIRQADSRLDVSQPCHAVVAILLNKTLTHSVQSLSRFIAPVPWVCWKSDFLARVAVRTALTATEYSEHKTRRMK